MFTRAFMLLLCTCCASFAAGQNASQRFRSMGAAAGFGYQTNINVKYNPVFFAGDLAWQFGKQLRSKFLAFYLEPQLNVVVTSRPFDYEFGTNFGLRFYQRLNANWLLYEMLGSGPHHISAKLPQQANGFIFSDNLAVGSLARLKKEKSIYLNFQIRFRHISNAGFKRPNLGVNTLHFLVGLSKIY